jgi:4-hydroxybenzoate polyprenyltransferase
MVKKLQPYLKLFRWPNLLMILFVQYLIRYSVVLWLDIPHFLSHFQFFLGALCSVLLAAAGYIINDLYDVDTDAVNKPERITIGKQISIRRAWSLYGWTNAAAIGLGYYLANLIRLPDLWLIPVVAAALLYLYAVDLKKRALIGNLIVSLLTAMPVFLVAIYDLLPALSLENTEVLRPFIYVICGYALFAFWMNFIREIVKDAEDLTGDTKSGFKTLAVLLGPKRIRFVLGILLTVLFSATGTFNYILFQNGDWLSAGYLLLAVNLPLIYLSWLLYKAQQSRDYRAPSKLLKLIMVLGILSMFVFTMSLKMNLV